MISRLEITSIHMDIDDNLRHYVTKKIGQCDRFLPRRIRPSLHAEITLREEKSKKEKSALAKLYYIYRMKLLPQPRAQSICMPQLI